MHARRDLRLVSKCVINVSNQVGFEGSLTVLGITQETVTIELALNGATDFNIEDKTKVFELARVPAPR